MSWLWWGILIVVLAIPAFFGVANTMTRRRHAGFGQAEVEAALQDVLTPESRVEGWSLFLSGPIDDPYCESIRRRCQEIDDRYAAMVDGKYMTDEGLAQIEEILAEVRHHR